MQVPACSTRVCTFTAQYAQPPAVGAYRTSSTVQYQEPRKAQVAVATVETVFKVRVNSIADGTDVYHRLTCTKTTIRPKMGHLDPLVEVMHRASGLELLSRT